MRVVQFRLLFCFEPFAIVWRRLKGFHHRGHRGAQGTSKSPPSFANGAKEGWGTRGLRIQAEFGVQLGLGVVTGPDVELLGLYYPLFQSRTPELQFIRAQLEMKRLLCSWLQTHPLKTFQLSHGPRRASGALMNIELNDCVSSVIACVGYVHRYIKSASHSCLRLAELEIVVGERRIAEAVSEGIKRFARSVPVARGEFGSVFGS